jgi:succinate-semialdehyde dehydrogenase/glutarate-semialdehyde dehydrogenase
LGGSNAVIICDDADLDAAVEVAVKARMQNSGQSCIAGKRLLIQEKIYDAFITQFKEAVINLVSGNPLLPKTQVGPLAKKDLADDLQKQIKQSVKKGAKILLGGKRVGNYHEPTILVDVQPGMAAFDEETFGPLAACTKISSIEEGFALAAQSRFGLGLTICTSNTKKALKYSHLVPDGSYFINEKVTSDPRLPFGGTKKSGYGRELSKAGLHEFVNKQTVYVK